MSGVKLHGEALVAHMLWRRYPRHDAFIRRVGGYWSAEIVVPNQRYPPFRTFVVAEADSIEKLQRDVEALHGT